jgi:hypothetical protein
VSGRLRVLGLGIIVLSLAAASPAVAAGKRSHGLAHHAVRAGSHDLTPAPACPTEDTCITIPGNSTVSGGTVDVGPTQNLGNNQWVYINTYGFAPGSALRINYCTDVAALPTPPLCLTSGNPLISNTDDVVQTLGDGTEALSYQVLEVDTTAPALVGQDPGNPDTTGSFFCDAATPCSIDITNTGVGGEASPAAVPDTTAVVPISFATSGVGCASTAANVTTESEFGMEFLLPLAAAASCSLSNPSIAFNTAADGEGAVSAIAAGSASVAFTDDPESSDQQQVLQQGNFKLIPVALTANVVAFKAVSFEDQVLFPLNSMDLTPTMAAGLLTGVYGTDSDSDMVECTKSCPIPPCLTPARGTKPTCSLLGMLNYQQGFSFPKAYEAFVRSDDAGSTGLLFSWLCNAPAESVAVTVPGTSSTFSSSFLEPSTGASVLDAGFGTFNTPLTSCPATTDQYPPAAIGSTTGIVYTGYNDPDQQSIKMYAYVNPNGGGSNAQAAFSTMNWAEARYYGESIASLQNASGAFVAPSTASLDAAVADASLNPDGTLTPNYKSTDPSAYPMTSVVYAAVCADATTTAQATSISEMLNQLLAVTGPTSTATLPDGFVPLTTSLAQQAQSAISTDVVGGAATVPSSCPAAAGSGSTGSSPVTTTTTPPASTTGGGAAAPAATSVSQKVSIAPVPAPQGGTTAFSGLSGSHPAIATPTTQAKKRGGMRLAFLTLSPSSSRVLLPLALLLGLLALVVGVFMALSSALRQQVLEMSRSFRRKLHMNRQPRAEPDGTVKSWLKLIGPKRSW